MRAVEALVVLAIVGTVLFAIVVRLVRPVLRRWRRGHAPWAMIERSDGELVEVFAAKPGDDDLLIGAAPFGADDFDSRLYELRAEGRAKVYALNQRGRK